MKLTAANVARLQLAPGETDRIFFDDTIAGFGVRLRAEGSPTWIFQYKLGTKQRRMTLGKVSSRTADEARNGFLEEGPDGRTHRRFGAKQLHAAVIQGVDPAGEKQISKARASDTVGILVTRYIEHQESRLRPRSLAEVRRHLEDHALPLHRLPLSSVDQRTIADRLRSIAKDSGDVAANRVRSSLSAMFSWAMGDGLASTNPVAHTNKQKEKSRERVLTGPELLTVWRAAGDDHYGAIIKLLILTGQRASEIAGLTWGEIDFDRSIITLPPERTKNGRAHEIPLAATARAILKEQPQRDGRDYVFGIGDGPFSGWSKSKANIDKRIADAGDKLEHWTQHDLRRSAATGMADIGVLPHVIEAVINHVSGHKGGIAGIYNRAQYTAEKAQALARWDEHISALVSGKASNIAQLRLKA